MTYSFNPQRYSQMEYRRCGKSGLKLPLLSIGMWHNFGDFDSFENFKTIILKAFDAGITHFDQANNYGPPPGASETNFGRVLQNELKSHRDELVISTKAGYDMWPGPYGEWGSRKYLLASLDQSLKRMGLDYVDIFYSHRPDPDTPLEETMGALHSAVQSGKALYVGISNYPADMTQRAAEILKQLGTPCLIHQPKYNMLDRWVEDGLLDTLDQNGMGCIAFSPLAQGQLTNKYLKGIPADSRAGKTHGHLQPDWITPDVISKVQQLNSIAENRGQSLAQMAIAWLLKDKRVTSVLIGPSSIKQFEENLASLNNATFTDDELTKINQIIANR